MATKQTHQEKEKEIPQEEVRQVRSRRTVKLILAKCPLCDLKYSEFAAVKTDEGKQYFQLVQFGTNPDGTGYESYFCQFCERFFMMIISEEPIMAQYEFKPKNEKKPKGGIGDLFEQIFGGGGNGNGQ